MSIFPLSSKHIWVSVSKLRKRVLVCNHLVEGLLRVRVPYVTAVFSQPTVFFSVKEGVAIV